MLVRQKSVVITNSGRQACALSWDPLLFLEPGPLFTKTVDHRSDASPTQSEQSSLSFSTASIWSEVCFEHLACIRGRYEKLLAQGSP